MEYSEPLFRELFDNSPDAYFIIELNDGGRISSCNRAAETMLRGDRSRINGMTPAQLSPILQPDGRLSSEAAVNQIKETLKSGKHSFEWMHRRLDETDFWVHVNFSIVNIQERRVLFASWRDISDWKQMEEDQKRTAVHYQTLMEMASDGIYVIDMDGNLTECNDAFRNMIGYSDQDDFVLNIKDWNASIPAEEIIDKIRELVQTPTVLEAKHRRRDGKIIDVEVNAVGVILGGKQYMYASTRDITARKEMENKLRNSRQLLADIFEFLPDATFVIDHNMKIIAWNQAMELMTGVTKAEIIGQGDYAYSLPFYGERRKLMIDLLDMSDEELHNHYSMITRQGQILIAEFFCPVLNNGKGAYLWGVAAPLYNLEGKRIGSIESIRDVSERDKMEKDLIRSNQELEQFAYVASHDLRSPLRAIENLSEWLAQDLGDDLPEESAKHLQLMRNRVKRMDRMLEDLLKYSRVGRMQAQIEEIDANTAIREIADDQDLNDRFTVTMDTLPTFTTYATPFRQVLQNLIGNAVKHHDKEKGNITVGVKKLDQFYEFFVADDGPGIPEQYREKVFGMFQTLRPRDEVEGSGIGLALVKKTVEHYGGNVKLDAVLPRGTLVTFTWPVNIVEVEK